MTSKSLFSRCVGVSLGSLLFASAAFGTPICVDAINPQYFYYNGHTMALVGSSAEYLCQVLQTPFVGSYCTYEAPATPGQLGYKDYIDELVNRGLNTFQLWVGLNHSPGRQPDGIGMPYTDEQPFSWNSNPNFLKWNVAANTWDGAYFTHIHEVLTYAQSKGIIVEVTLFDPWSGDWTLGPWYSVNIYNGSGLANRGDLVSFPSGTTGCSLLSAGARARQVSLMQHTASQLNDLNNFYWEIANEVDFNASSGLTSAQVGTWHDCMIQQLYNYEATLPNGHHLIGVNYHQTGSLDTIENNSYPSSVPHIKVVNAHYVTLRDTTRRGAISLIRDYHGGSNGELNRVFGFNETKITPFQTSAEAARAEAWEFMLDGGGVYDHLGYQWNTSPVAANTRAYLGFLNNFLKGLHLRRAFRSALDMSGRPSWLPTIPTYASTDGSSSGAKIFWGAMQEGQESYVLYIHHSTVTTGGATSYVQPSSINQLRTIDVQLGSAGLTYSVQWINPATGSVILSTTLPGDGLRRSLTVPTYTYDIALKISNGLTNVVSATCSAF